MIRARAVTNRIFISPKRPYFIHACATWQVLPSNISTMFVNKLLEILRWQDERKDFLPLQSQSRTLFSEAQQKLHLAPCWIQMFLLAFFYGLLMYFPKRRESIFNIYPLSLQYCLKREFNKYLVFLLMALHFFIVIVSYFAVTSLQLWQFYARKVHIKCKLFAPSRKAPPGFRIQIRPTRQNWIWILYIFYLIKM